MYISMLGLLIIAAWAVKDLVANRPRWRVIAATLAGAALISAVILTRTQIRHWQNGVTLFEHTLKITENNTIAENNYGLALSEAGRLSEAEMHLSKALQICPTNSEALNNLGVVFLKQEKFNEAIACFSKLLQHKKGSAETYYQMALVSGMQEKYDDAVKYLAKALELDPRYPDAHNKMGAALLAMGKTNEAIVYLNEALRINPRQAIVYANLGKAYEQSGEYEAAIRNWTKAVELKPDSIEVLTNMAWLLAVTGDVSAQAADKAIGFAKRACELRGYKDHNSLDALAAAYAAGGRFEDAVRTAQQAIDGAKADGREDLAGEIKNRMELYKTGQRYQQK
jgi:superkiller protein 3